MYFSKKTLPFLLLSSALFTSSCKHNVNGLTLKLGKGELSGDSEQNQEQTQQQLSLAKATQRATNQQAFEACLKRLYENNKYKGNEHYQLIEKIQSYYYDEKLTIPAFLAKSYEDCGTSDENLWAYNWDFDTVYRRLNKDEDGHIPALKAVCYALWQVCKDKKQVCNREKEGPQKREAAYQKATTALRALESTIRLCAPGEQQQAFEQQLKKIVDGVSVHSPIAAFGEVYKTAIRSDITRSNKVKRRLKTIKDAIDSLPQVRTGYKDEEREALLAVYKALQPCPQAKDKKAQEKAYKKAIKALNALQRVIDNNKPGEYQQAFEKQLQKSCNANIRALAEVHYAYDSSLTKKIAINAIKGNPHHIKGEEEFKKVCNQLIQVYSAKNKEQAYRKAVTALNAYQAAQKNNAAVKKQEKKQKKKTRKGIRGIISKPKQQPLALK